LTPAKKQGVDPAAEMLGAERAVVRERLVADWS